MQHAAFKKKAQELDRQDSLASFQNRFVRDENVIYLDGNSLGRLPLKTVDILEQTIRHQWGNRLIRSWNEQWLALSQRIAAKIANLIGAQPDEVFIGDSTSVNLYKLAYGALSVRPDKTKILTDDLNFPSDIYILQGLIANHFPHMQLDMIKSPNGIDISPHIIERKISSDTALVCLSHVAYKSSFLYPMQDLTRHIHQHGAWVLWDFSHSAGAVPIDVKTADIDLAVGCTYKYLNGGPGAPAFCYVKKEMQKEIRNPIWGWFGHRDPFAFTPSYQPSDSISQFAAGTPAILSLAAVEPGVDCLLEAGMKNLRDKSVKQSHFFLELYDALLEQEGFSLGSPRKDSARGSHISLQHPEGYRITRAMIEPRDGSKSIIPDFRPPDHIRLGIAPLYNTFTELYETAVRMQSITGQKQYKEYEKDRLNVP